MGLKDFFSGGKKINGLIGYFGLEDWWLSEFSVDERRYIVETFQPLGSSGNSLTSGVTGGTSQTVVGLLQSLSGWFQKKKDSHIAYRLLAKAEELSKTEGTAVDVHFLYNRKINIS